MPIQPYNPVPIPQFNPQPAPTTADQFTRMLEPIIKMQQMKMQKQQMEQNMLMNEQAMQMNRMRMDQSQTEFDWKKDDKAREKALRDEMRRLFESGAATSQSIREVIGKYANSPQEFSSLVKEMKQEAFDIAETAMKLRDPNMANKAAELLQQVTGADVTGEALLKPGSKTTIKTDDQIVIVDADTGKVLQQTDITSQRQKEKDKLDADYKRAAIGNLAADNARQDRRLEWEKGDREELRKIKLKQIESKTMSSAFKKGEPLERMSYVDSIIKDYIQLHSDNFTENTMKTADFRQLRDTSYRNLKQTVKAHNELVLQELSEGIITKELAAYALREVPGVGQKTSGGSGEETPEQAAIRKGKEKKMRPATPPPVGTDNYPALPPVGMWEKPLPDEQKIYELFRKK